MFKQFINTLQGDEFFMLISLLIFFLFFVVAAIVLIKMKKKHVDYMSNIPFENKKDESN
jgi:cbb3-type cytochrome oxidase subunit 3